MEIGDKVSYRYVANYIMEVRVLVGQVVAIHGEWVVIFVYAHAQDNLNPYIVKKKENIELYYADE